MESAMNVLGFTVSVDQTRKARWTRRGVALVTAIGLAVVGGVAYAYWTTTGSGAGTAASGAALGLTLTPGTVNTNTLYPQATGDVAIAISNPNPFPVSIDQITFPASPATAYSNAGLTTPNANCNSGGTGVAWAYASKNLTGVIVAKKTGSTNGTLTL